MEDNQNLLAEASKTINSQTQIEFRDVLRIFSKRNAKVFTVEQTIEDLSPQQQLDWLKSVEEMRLRQENQQVANDLDKNQNE